MPARINHVIFGIVLLPFVLGCEFKTFDHKRAEITHLRMIGITAETCKLAYGKCPTSINSLEFQEYLDGETIDDEWGTPVEYIASEGGYSLTSAGPDKRNGTADDIRLTSEQVENWDKTEIREITM